MRVDNEGYPSKKISGISSKKLSPNDFTTCKAVLNKVYFDNSTLNNLWEEEEPIKSLLIECFLSHYYLRLSTINLAEIAATPDEEKRNEIFRLAIRLSQGRAPLGDPIEFLKEVLDTYKFTAHLIHPPQPTAVFMLNDIPIWLKFLKSTALFDESYRLPAKQEVSDGHNWDKNISLIRSHIQAVVQKLSVKDRKSILRSERSFIKGFMKERTFFFHLIEYFIKAEPHRSHLIGREMEILRGLDVWAVLTCSFSLMMYHLHYKQEGHSLKKNAGSSDILQAVYLSEIDVFVTGDKGQRRLFRIAKLFASRKTEVVSYMEFRRRLLVSV